MHFDAHFFTSAVNEAKIVQGTIPPSPTFSIDSRTIQKDNIFIALEGANLDGHNFLQEVLSKECVGIVINENKSYVLNKIDKKLLNNKLVITVPHTLTALVSLARTWRNLFTKPIIAITGSVGKTSTKNFLASIVKFDGRNYLVSKGNQNTLIGVSLNILRLTQDHDGAIFEVGINQRGEMSRIVEVLRPTSALITGIGHSHMEGLGSLSDIAAEKRDIFKYLKEGNVGFINGDQPVLSQVSYNHPVIKFGFKTVNQIQARKVSADGSTTKFLLKIYKDKYPVVLPNNHVGALINTLAATAVAQHLGIAHDVIVSAIQKPVIVPGRFEKRSLKSYKGLVINDCYNASPESMKAALLAFQKLDTQANKVAVLGDMLELGTDSAFWHRQLGRFLRKVPSLKHVILVGSLVEWTKKTLPVGLSVEHVATWQDALERVKYQLNNESVVLVKGSLGMKLGNLVNDLTIVPTYEY